MAVDNGNGNVRLYVERRISIGNIVTIGSVITASIVGLITLGQYKASLEGHLNSLDEHVRMVANQTIGYVPWEQRGYVTLPRER